MKNKKKFFLSHSGKDRESALKISGEIKSLQFNSSYVIDVFNTSEPQYRFAELEGIGPGAELRKELKKRENELRSYLEENLLSSDIYLLLITKLSLIENSKWIVFEMETATKNDKSFIPCLYNGASFGELPGIARRFQSVDLNSESGFSYLSKAVEHCFSNE